MSDRKNFVKAHSRESPFPRIHTRYEARDELYLSDDPVVSGGEIGLYVLERHRTAPGEMQAHVFDQHMLMLHMGVGAVPFSSRINGRRLNGAFIPGRLRFLAAGDNLSTSWNLFHESILIAFYPQVIHCALGEDVCGAPCSLTSNIASHDDSTLAHLVLAMEGHLTSGRRSGKLFEQSLLATIAAHLLCSYGSLRKGCRHGVPLTTWKRKKIEEYVRENLSRDIHLQDIACSVNLSPYYLSRSFKAATGRGLWQFVLECRVRQAMRLIRDGRSPSLAYVARSCGFESYSQFTAAFRRFVGQLPSEYRAVHRR